MSLFVSFIISPDSMRQFNQVFGSATDLPTNLEDLLESCNLLFEYQIPDDILAAYCSARGNRDSIATALEITSSTQATSVGGAKMLNKFQLGDMLESSRPAFLSFSFDEVKLKNLIESKFQRIEKDQSLDLLLNDLTIKLIHLRAIIYSVKCIDGLSSDAVWNELRVQCMMSLFLNHAIKAWYSGGDGKKLLEVTAANKDRIEFPGKNQEGQEVDWKGYSDLKCCPVDVPDISQSTATIEMKVPFGKSGSTLFHSKAFRPKQQLLGQAIGLCSLQSAETQATTSDRTISSLSYLTDCVALSVMYYTPETGAYLSSRVVDARAFCMRILLMCCDVSAEEWNSLLAEASIAVVDLREDEEEVSRSSTTPEGQNGDAIALNPSDSQSGRITRSMAANANASTRKRNVETLCGTIGWEDEEEHERRLEEISNVMRWEAKCLGIRNLDAEELRHLNN